MSLANDCDEMAAYILRQDEKYSIVSDVLLRAAAALRERPTEKHSEGRRLSPKELIEAVRGVLSAVRNGSGPIAVVVNNNQPGTQHVIETAPNVTLDIGTPLYAAPQ